ncbi:MAG: hypothetical protein PWP60_574 [Candidatus Atribacteria bacterium]|uniref:MBL fold metallo-hydrolase n=1 Tax=Thermatribacter velox TaxID=3039681 RepID=A0ABZ2YF61_9BACT|nr:hypothetical protein [Candidatus Atribacteria bacterium]
MKITWFGHAFFLAETAEGIRIAFDPFDSSVGYPLPEVTADLVCVSHDHYDHNNVALIKGNPRIVNQSGSIKYNGITISAFKTFHDEERGRKRGENLVYRVEADGIVLLHLGDLGDIPPAGEIEAWKPVDIVFVPVGGVYTIDHNQAHRLVTQINPRVIVPMHYKTPYLSFALNAVDPFLKLFPRVRRFETSTLEVTKESLPQQEEVWLPKVP